MIKRRPRKVKRRPDWTIGYTARVNGRILEPGTEVSLRVAKGRYRFLRSVTNAAGETWLEFWGAPAGVHPTVRHVYPDAVKRVHRIKRTAAAEVAVRKAARRESRSRDNGESHGTLT